ncbi:YajG family lipoprotein [Spiribacter halobius]|nr:YajG family lipoprotein [Spiribacter halobius]UEX78577.1 YajG family lipoprotein [Spiribacter halobius]
MKLLRLLPLLVLSALLGACAQTTQSVRLGPEPPETGPVLGDERVVALRVVDTRENPDLGTLENRDGDPARVITDQNLAYVVELAAGEALLGYGLRPTVWEESYTPRLQIDIEQLEHSVDADLPRDVATRVTLRARAVDNGQRYTSQARTELTDRRPTAPDAEANAAYINEAITRALGRLLDEELAAFLAGQAD